MTVPERRQRLLLLAPSAYPLGGVATWLDYLVPGLEGRGWNVTVALTSGRYHDVGRYLAAHPALLGRIVTVEAPTGTREGRIRALARYFRQTGPDVILVVNIVDAYAAAARLRRDSAFSGRVVMTLHGIQPDFYADMADNRNLMDAVIATNRLSCGLAFARGGLPAQRVFYAPYGVDAPPSGRRCAPEGRRLAICWAGRLEEFQKRVSDLCAVVRRLEAWRFPCEVLVAGDGPDRGILQACLDERRMFVDLRWLGDVRAAEMPEKVYARADVLLITSYWETGPIVAWEAMAHGLAVVSSRFLGCGREGALRHEANCLLFGIGDAADAAAHILRLRDDEETRRRLCSAGARLVRERYTRERSIAAWDEALQRIRALPPRPPASPAPRAAPCGRLDRWFGPAVGESLRRWSRRRAVHAEPGGEWPHTCSQLMDDEIAPFWETAAALDRTDTAGEFPAWEMAASSGG